MKKMKKMNGKPYFVGDKEAVTQYCHGCVEFANRVKQLEKALRIACKLIVKEEGCPSYNWGKSLVDWPECEECWDYSGDFRDVDINRDTNCWIKWAVEQGIKNNENNFS